MQITLSFDNFTELPYTSGTVQNISSQATVEICQDDTANTGLILGPGEWFSWSNSTIYARSAWDYEPTATCAVVPFKKGGEGGGSEYILPVATASKLGGVKSSDEAGAIKVDSLGKMTYNAPSSTPLSAPDWATNTAYPENALVEYSDNIYICLTAHTSGTFADDLANGKWKLVSMTLTAATSSELGGVKSNSVDGGVTVDSDGKMNINLPTATTSALGGVKVGDGLSVTADGTLSATATGGGISIWQANTAYNVNDVVIDSNLIWQCATAHISSTTFDESKWICISGGEISNGYEIVTLWEGVGNVLNQVLTLNDSYNNYDYILGTMADGAGIVFASNILETISGNGLYIMGVLSSGGVKRGFLRFSTNQVTIEEATGLDSSKYISKIQGIRKAKPIVSSGMKYETLWEGEAGSLSDTYSNVLVLLSDSIRKYKKIGMTLIGNYGGGTGIYYREFDVPSFIAFIESDIGNRFYNFCVGYSSSGDYVEIQSDSTDTQFNLFGKKTQITKIIGISEGVQIPTGVQAARVTLFEGRVTSTATLLDSYTNYDELEFVIAFDVGYDSIKQYTVATDVIKSTAKTSNVIIFPWGYPNSGRYLELQPISSNTEFGFDVSEAYLTKIVGIKYIQPDSYSTEEKLIGTWIDGKPLYQKTIAYTSTFYNGWTTVYIFDTDITPVDIKATVHNIALDAIIPLATISSDAEFMINYSLHNRNVNMYVRRGSDAWNNAYITIQYTKN